MTVKSKQNLNTHVIKNEQGFAMISIYEYRCKQGSTNRNLTPQSRCKGWETEMGAGLKGCLAPALR
jgi:hypothetical protein